MFETALDESEHELDHIEEGVVWRRVHSFHSLEQKEVLHDDCVVHGCVIEDDLQRFRSVSLFQPKNRFEEEAEDQHRAEIALGKLKSNDLLQADDHQNVSGLELEERFEACWLQLHPPSFCFESLLIDRSHIKEKQFFFLVIVMIDQINHEVDSSDLLLLVISSELFRFRILQIQILCESSKTLK